jgi:hypothetical protein
MDTVESTLIRRFKFFSLYRELWQFDACDTPSEMFVYRNHAGDYLDCKHRNIRPWLIRKIDELCMETMKTYPDHCVCSIGRAGDGRWYGWSHRAMCSFGIGDRIFEEKYGNDSAPFIKHGHKSIKTEADARLAATRFAASVS